MCVCVCERDVACALLICMYARKRGHSGAYECVTARAGHGRDKKGEESGTIYRLRGGAEHVKARRHCAEEIRLAREFVCPRNRWQHR